MALAVDSISFDAVRVALNLVANMQRLEMTARFFIQRLEQSGISEQRRQTVSKIDYQALREAAEAIKIAATPQKLLAFRMKVTPQVVLALLDERERNQQYIKRRDQENEDIALTVGKLRFELEAEKKRIAELEAEPVSQTYKLNEPSGNSPVTPDGWISCSEQMPVIGELNWRTSFPLLVTCEIGVIPAYYGFVRVNGNKHYGFMESLKYGDDNGNHPQTNEYGLISNVTHWMPLPEPPQEAK
ncbi:TPA: ead/Ea22-like family protein [Escherichia coli]|nr:ead/Ea22-like family protein [Escherichia coli]